MKILVIGLFVLLSVSLPAVNYYVSPTGSDANAGTLQSPRFNISSLVNIVNPGDTIFVLPGRYNYNATTRIIRSGTSASRICIFGTGYNTAAERPLLNYTAQGPGDSNRAFLLEAGADYWHFKGLIIQEAGDNAIKIESNWNIIEFCDFDACYDSGIQIGLNKNSGANDGTCAYNYILNCDSYNNCDSHKSGGNADGFAAKLFCGPGNIFENCRAWNNSDDGWDMYSNTFGVLMLNCRTWHNGDKNTLRGGQYGNGNGFKMGGNSTYSRGTNIAVGCIGFDLSNNTIAMQLASAQRNVDGSIPDNGFCRLKPTSDCIDKGQVVSYTFLGVKYDIPYHGTAPDLGAYEFNPSTAVFNPKQMNFSTLKVMGSAINDISTISFQLENATFISLDIIDMNGCIVMKCVDNQLFPAGDNYHIAYLGNLPQGNYIARLSNDKAAMQTIKFTR